MAWRGHRQFYPALSDEGSRRVSGRYHRGPDCFPHGPIWPALYLALAPETAVLEIARQVPPGRWPPKNYRFSEIGVSLQLVIDCSDPASFGLSMDALCN